MIKNLNENDVSQICCQNKYILSGNKLFKHTQIRPQEAEISPTSVAARFKSAPLSKTKNVERLVKNLTENYVSQICCQNKNCLSLDELFVKIRPQEAKKLLTSGARSVQNCTI